MLHRGSLKHWPTITLNWRFVGRNVDLAVQCAACSVSRCRQVPYNFRTIEEGRKGVGRVQWIHGYVYGVTSTYCGASNQQHIKLK